MASAEAGYISSPSRQSDDSGLKTLTQLVTRDSWTDTRSGMVEDFAGELAQLFECEPSGSCGSTASI